MKTSKKSPASELPPEDLLSLRQAAKRLGIGESTLRRHKDEGEITFRKVGRLIRFAEQDLATFAAPIIPNKIRA